MTSDVPIGSLAPRRRSSLFSVLGTRAGVLVTSWLYAATLFYAHATYLSVRWGYFGFSYREPNPLELVFMVALVTGAALFVPLRLDKPSSGALWILYALVVIPICVITSNLHVNALGDYGAALLCLVGGFAAACVITQRGRTEKVGFALPPENLDRVLLALWGAAAVMVLVSYGSLMSFASLADMYVQRQIFTEATSGPISYVISHFSAVFCPALVVLGLFRRKYWLTAIGVIGFLMVYAAVASKASLIMPLVLFVLYIFFTTRIEGLNTTGFLTAALLVPMALLLFLENLFDLPLVTFLVDTLLFRAVAIPGLTFSQYHDYFGTFGHTMWSNVRGLDLIISPPANLENDLNWPDLGRLVGEYYYGDYRIQANANLFSGEGVAAAGALGVLVISVVLGAWLRLLDVLTRAWDYRFVVVALFPLYSSLTNSHLSTTQTSFGGALWLLLFLLYMPRTGARVLAGPQVRKPPRRRAAQ